VSNRLLIFVAAAAAFALALGIRWAALRERRAAEAALDSLHRRQAELGAAMGRQGERLAAADTDRAALREALRTGGAAPVPAAHTGARAETPSLASILESNPELFKLGLRAYRAGLSGHFERLYRDLGLTPGQVSAFEDLMTEHEEDILDLEATAAAEGFPRNDPAVLALRQRQEDQLRAAQEALLGGEGYRRLQLYDRMQPVMDIVTGVATTVAMTSAPLSSAQAAALTDFLAGSSGSFRGGARADPDTIDWDVALPQASGMLEPGQAAALRAEADKLKLEKLRTQFDSRAAGRPPTPTSSPSP
jgi:hypothetical protein